MLPNLKSHINKERDFLFIYLFISVVIHWLKFNEGEIGVKILAM